jgi:cell division protein FtsI (penicillin-binding protein 3)
MSEASPSRWIRVRMVGTGVLLLALFGGVVLKAYRLHATEGPKLQEMAEQQYLKEIRVPPRRGTIFDRNRTPLAVSVDVDSVFANPRVVGKRAPETARALAGALGLEGGALERQLSGRRYFVWLKRRVSPREAAAVRALHLKGIALTPESRRFYPNHRLAGNVVGFAGLDAKGLEGVELSFDGWLRGSPARLAGLRDALGRPVLSEGVVQRPSEGHDIQLTLDKVIQYETERALDEAYRGVKPKTGWVAAVVLEPRSGDVLAMATVPTYDPNRYQEAKSAEWRNRSITDAFEPGSTLKTFTVAAALEAGVAKPDEVLDCERGAWRVGHYTIHDSHRYDKLDVGEVLKKSSNICAAKLAFRLGKRSTVSFLRRYGFGRRTGVTLPGERAGVLRDPRRLADVGLANLAFGQGMTTTVIQLAQGYGAVANGGVMMRPRIVRKILRGKGDPVKVVEPRGRRVMPAWVARTLLKMLTGVTEAGGTGMDAALERFSVAGKTGTAQKVDPVTGTYATDRWLSSFVGIVPASRPALAIMVVMNEPEGDKHYGGEVAGPVFKRIAEKALAYLGVKPDRRGGERPAGQQAPAAAVATEGYVSIDPAPPLPGKGGPRGQILVPDFTGMSITEAISAARKAGLRVELGGSGRAVAQSPGPGPAPKRTVCRVSFRPPR